MYFVFTPHTEATYCTQHRANMVAEKSRLTKSQAKCFQQTKTQSGEACDNRPAQTDGAAVRDATRDTLMQHSA